VSLLRPCRGVLLEQTYCSQARVSERTTYKVPCTSLKEAAEFACPTRVSCQPQVVDQV
jgi:hypothetical protein